MLLSSSRAAGASSRPADLTSRTRSSRTDERLSVDTKQRFAIGCVCRMDSYSLLADIDRVPWQERRFFVGRHPVGRHRSQITPATGKPSTRHGMSFLGPDAENGLPESRIRASDWAGRYFIPLKNGGVSGPQGAACVRFPLL